MNILENPIEIVADPDLQNIKVQAQKQRHGYYKVRFHNLVIHCCDLLSFYMAGKDIFLHQIYNINTSNPAPRIIDGGGHIGLFTLYAKVRFPQSKVIVFEPEALSLELLRRNIADNGLQGVTIVESGLHDRDGQISFSADGSDGSSLSHGGDGETTIQITKLSPYLNEQIDFLKLNIEGSELEVIREVEQHLDRVQELVIEYHGFPSLGQRLHLILEVLDRSGFRYMVHDFDAETNSASKPPFFIDTERQFFHLIYGRKLFERKTVTSSVGDELSRAEPVCRKFGFSRGKPIDRFYIESFLKGHGKEIRGHVLEVAESTYTRQFGIDVSKSDVLHAHPEPEATIIADLCEAESLPHEQFDCIILTQTLQFLYDYREALRNITQALKPGGTLLLTGSGISQISRFDMDRWGEYWRFTDKSLHDLLLEYCPECDVHVETYGNVAAAKAFLDGRASEELSE